MQYIMIYHFQYHRHAISISSIIYQLVISTSSCFPLVQLILSCIQGTIQTNLSLQLGLAAIDVNVTYT